MRTFIAIPLDEQAHNQLSALQSKLRRSDADVKWVDASNIHLTLKFLGEIDDTQAENVKLYLSEIAKTHRPFTIHLQGIGAFPRIAYPRVVWAGIDEGAGECQELARATDEAMARLGFEKENRPFSPHLTLGRVRSPRNRSRLIALLEKEKNFASRGKVSVEKIILFQSTLTPKGSIYTPVKEFPLG